MEVKTPKPPVHYDLCDACRRPILSDDGVRLIITYRLHDNEDCFEMYAAKVERGMIKVPFNLDGKNKKK